MVHTDNTMQFTASGSTSAMTIDSSGKVAINMTSPLTVASGYGALTVGGSTGGGIILSDSSSGHGQVYANSSQLTVDAFGSRNLTFQTNGSERARIDSSGNLLVNTRTTAVANGTNTGIALTSGNQLAIGANNDVVAYLNRISTDGSIIEFRKDGSAVGSIGTKSGRPFLVNNVDGGINLSTDGYGRALLLPADQNGSPEDNLHYLGSSSYRWRDLYLSGAVNADKALLGRTASTSAKLHLEQATSVHMDMNSVGDNRGKIGSKVNDLYIGHSSGSGRIYFKNNVNSDGHPADSGDTKMVITDSGVGIGTASPATGYKLDITGLSGYDDILRLTAVGTNIGARINLTNTGTGVARINATNNSLALQTAGIEAMRIDSSQRVGIGTTSASHPLNVVNSGELQAEFSGYSHASSANNSRAGSGSIRLGSGVGTTGLLIDYTDQGQTLGLIKNEYVASGDSELRLQSPFLSFYTGTSAAERARIDSSGRLGIGTTSPNRTLNLHVAANDSNFTQFTNSTTGEVGSNGFLVGIGSAGNAELWNYEAQPIIFATSSSERARIDSSGNFLVGTTSYNNDIAGIGFGSGNFLYATRSSNVAASFGRLSNDGDIIDFRKDAAIVGSIGASGGDLYLDTSGGELSIRINGTTKYEFDSSQFYSKTDGQTSLGVSSNRFNNLHLSGIINPDAITSFINAYSATVANGPFVYVSSSGSITVGTDSTSARNVMGFRNPNGEIGTITTSGSSTSYNTSSDYRLKENVDYDFNALERVAQLKPARFNFIADADTTVDGFLAHEVSDIVPEAIHGKKDAVDDEGNPEYQGIDQSKLVPLLTKAIQEQQTQIEELKQEIQNLKENKMDWNVNTVDVHPHEEGHDDVIYNVHWSVSKVDGDYVASSYGTQTIDTSDLSDFTAFADVTADMVKGWVIDAMGEEEVANLEASLDAQIEEQKNPTSITKTLES